LDKADDDFTAGWAAAIIAAQRWHESAAKHALIQARRDRFPKRFEEEAKVHARSAEALATLSPDDV
jgi:hypothetical protein